MSWRKYENLTTISPCIYLLKNQQLALPESSESRKISRGCLQRKGYASLLKELSNFINSAKLFLEAFAKLTICVLESFLISSISE